MRTDSEQGVLWESYGNTTEETTPIKRRTMALHPSISSQSYTLEVHQTVRETCQLRLLISDVVKIRELLQLQDEIDRIQSHESKTSLWILVERPEIMRPFLLSWIVDLEERGQHRFSLRVPREVLNRRSVAQVLERLSHLAYF